MLQEINVIQDSKNKNFYFIEDKNLFKTRKFLTKKEVEEERKSLQKA